ncbi:amidase/aspartyl-tRNA(Asn)/glutamyl-tRNA(Gln) amidotransferase subunit A [Naumannella cuiyingiana]|uniref:Amidase/aspartyl-tRNA(Asn)/glutamyl-tRNA(Gln) amidotransferase subunit A n=1 Tax=Naumannella cuiyingiana TaxID=1347891 RepID=A0A7Z0D8V6_9ACTN|nr:amidase family protein [Naumannella cuiyingiana]NYI70965.1 amidase/aspartyl-tRNA(Asn)/glutamyl-tRNA(Gln) amidotransferase subunit A [Naumannella cuiyingiana]
MSEGMSIATLGESWSAGRGAPSERLDAVLGRIERINPTINAMADLDLDGATIAAREADRRWASGSPLGPLDGVPVTVKDSIPMRGLPWRHGLRAHRGAAGGQADGPIVARLRAAGAIIVGKTTMPDLGMSASGVSSAYGIVRNPWDTSLSPGGSSAGAGAALAAGLCDAAVGTDIAGSVRLPAAHCGVVALKPTQGRIAHPPASTMRSAGPMGRWVADVAALYSVLAGPDLADPLSLPAEVPGDGDAFDPRGMRVGVLTDLGYGFSADPAVLAAVRRAADALAAAGAVVETITPPFADDPFPALDRIFGTRALAEIHGLGERGAGGGVDPRLVRWAQRVAGQSNLDHYADLATVAHSAARFSTALAGHDVVVSPVLPVTAFPAEELGLDPEHPLAHCGFTSWFNQTGQPAVSLPMCWPGGLPAAIQVAGPRFDDRRVLAAAQWLEARAEERPAWPDPTGGGS